MNHQRQQDGPDPDFFPEDLSSEEEERLREVWALAADAEPGGEGTSVDTEQALSQFQETLDTGEEAPSSSPPHKESEQSREHGSSGRASRSRKKKRSRWRATRWAAAALVLIAAGAVLAYWWQQPVVRAASQGEQLSFTLPDGSKVQLNSGSALRYDRSFGDARVLFLKGEAFFEVDSDERPFLVRTHNAKVRALGTAFNVQARPDAPSAGTQVTLVEGTVEVGSREAGAKTVQMRPGETRRVQGREARLSEPLAVTVKEATAWRRGDLIVKNRPLESLLPEVERRFAVELAVRPDSLRQQRISLALRKPSSAEAVVRDVALVLGLQYRETAGGFTLHE
ncbi:ferric-dicitrate binding protein FerR (iron transport regulator) [Salinibacter ruber]|uniref:FecR family protein n=1 Tax=Salinibacter ruber TaxID=146919 RepID=UPI0021684E76|nr:ferric-dicitrate binding protein FerR (iron transport regulator) [Salinibacter ruber]